MAAFLHGLLQDSLSQCLMLWSCCPLVFRFACPSLSHDAHVDMRCLVRYVSVADKQSVIPPQDLRIHEAMRVHGVPATTLPPEPS